MVNNFEIDEKDEFNASATYTRPRIAMDNNVLAHDPTAQEAPMESNISMSSNSEYDQEADLTDRQQQPELPTTYNHHNMNELEEEIGKDVHLPEVVKPQA